MMISLAAGKPHAKRKIRKEYRRLLGIARKAGANLDGELQTIEDTYQPYEFLFSTSGGCYCRH